MSFFRLGLILVLLWGIPFVVSALDYTDLYPHLPELPGFKAEPPSGSSVKAFGGMMIQAERTYRSGKKSLIARIHIGPAVTMMWMPFSMQVSYDNPEERLDTISIEGFPAKIIVHKKEKRGEVYVLLTQKGQPKALFTIDYEGLSWEEAQKCFSRFKLKDLVQKIP